MTTLARRRGTALLASLIGAALALTGCSTADPDPTETTSENSGDAAFPVTIETVRGPVTVNEKPERIVVLDSPYVELLSILDEEPAVWAAFLQSTDQVTENLPWTEGTFESDPDPGLFNADFTVNVEAVAAEKPDLILTTVWIDDQIYEQLAQIAPTYGDTGAPGVTWQDQLTALATLTGHDTAIVDQVSAELDAEYAAARERLSGLQGATFQTPSYSDGTFWLNYLGNIALIDLGLVPGESQPDSVANDNVQVSLENIDRLNADVLFVQLGLRGPEVEAEAREALDADPRVPELTASQNGTWIELTASEWSAIHSGGTPASNRWFLDQVIPRLDASTLNQSEQ